MTRADLTDQHIRADIQDLVYAVQHGARRSATLDETMGPLMALVQRYADLQARTVPTTVYVVSWPRASATALTPLPDALFPTPPGGHQWTPRPRALTGRWARRPVTA
jgi:hypothetical protein